MYDQYFQGPRPYNKAVYKALFTDEILPFESSFASAISKSLDSKQKTEATAYDNFKKSQLEKAEAKKQEEQKKRQMVLQPQLIEKKTEVKSDQTGIAKLVNDAPTERD